MYRWSCWRWLSCPFTSTSPCSEAYTRASSTAPFSISYEASGLHLLSKSVNEVTEKVLKFHCTLKQTLEFGLCDGDPVDIFKYSLKMHQHLIQVLILIESIKLGVGLKMFSGSPFHSILYISYTELGDLKVVCIDQQLIFHIQNSVFKGGTFPIWELERIEQFCCTAWSV